jgi:hypothetical protein
VKIQRLKARWWILRNHGKSLNRRAVVEQFLWDCFHGKRPLPDKEACKHLALHLGVPTADGLTLKERLGE